MAWRGIGYGGNDDEPGDVAPPSSKSPAAQASTKEHCPDCNAEVESCHKFCGGCGYSLQKARAIRAGDGPKSACGSCGTAHVPNAKFCHSCGHEHS